MITGIQERKSKMFSQRRILISTSKDMSRIVVPTILHLINQLCAQQMRSQFHYLAKVGHSSSRLNCSNIYLQTDTVFVPVTFIFHSKGVDMLSCQVQLLQGHGRACHIHTSLHKH